MSKQWIGSWAAGATAAVVISGSALTGCSTGGGGTASSTTNAGPPRTSISAATSVSPRDAAASASALQAAFVAVVAEVRPQVVQISTGSGLGSGVVYDRAGDVVTNAHVVGAATGFTVQLLDGQQVTATLVGVYAPDDLAVIRLTGTTNLSPATFADSSSVKVGEIVFAVGNPLGLSSSVTDGIVSYNGRPVSEGNGVVLPSTIQTSAPINPGNSGGALVDLAGHVIGIPTLAAADQQVGGGAASGIGFAVPSNTVELIVPQLIESGHVTHSDRAALDLSAADALASTGQPLGAVVVGLTPGGSAERAGVREGDLITMLAGKQVTSLADLQNVLAQLAPGRDVSLVVKSRDGTERSLTAVLGQLQG